MTSSYILPNESLKISVLALATSSALSAFSGINLTISIGVSSSFSQTFSGTSSNGTSAIIQSFSTAAWTPETFSIVASWNSGSGAAISSNGLTVNLVNPTSGTLSQVFTAIQEATGTTTLDTAPVAYSILSTNASGRNFSRTTSTGSNADYNGTTVTETHFGIFNPATSYTVVWIS